MPDLIRHPVALQSEKALDSAKASLRARVKPGMTNMPVLWMKGKIHNYDTAFQGRGNELSYRSLCGQSLLIYSKRDSNG
jgi:hypothetical protein